MSLTIAQESPLTEDAHRLIAGSRAALRAVYAEEECFGFSAAQLNHPNVTFLVARRDGSAVGCVALVDQGRYAEVKRLFVTAAARGTGAAQALMQVLETQAAQHHAKIKLETGDKLIAAVQLYNRLGYRQRPPFGTYVEHPASLFLEKSL